jgi:hypothetical protein
MSYTLDKGEACMPKNAKGVVMPAGPESQEEMTVFVLRIKGSGDTMRKGFDALNHAVSALGTGQAVVAATKRLPAGPLKPQDFEIEEEASNVNEAIAEEGTEATTIEAATTQSNGKPKPRPKPAFLTDFDLTVSEKPWKDFFSEFAPKSDQDKYLLAALWTTENAQTPEFSLGHIFTLFRAAKWNEPSDFSAPMRVMKSKNSYFENPTRKKWKLTQIGTDAARAVVKQ